MEIFFFSETPSTQSTAVVESAHRLSAMTTAVNAIGEVPAAAASLLGNSFTMKSIFKVSFNVARFVDILSNLATVFIMVTSESKNSKKQIF